MSHPDACHSYDDRRRFVLAGAVFDCAIRHLEAGQFAVADGVEDLLSGVLCDWHEDKVASVYTEMVIGLDVEVQF